MNVTTPVIIKHTAQNPGSILGQKLAVMEIVDSLSPKELQQYSAFHPKNLKHYVETQKKWLQDSTYFLGIDLGCGPNAMEIAEKILGTCHSQRYRAYYALEFPDRVTIDCEHSKRMKTAKPKPDTDQ